MLEKQGEKCFDNHQGKWWQVTVTSNPKSQVSQLEAKNRFSKKIEKKTKEGAAGKKEILSTVQDLFDDGEL